MVGCCISNQYARVVIHIFVAHSQASIYQLVNERLALGTTRMRREMLRAVNGGMYCQRGRAGGGGRDSFGWPLCSFNFATATLKRNISY